jgi:acetyl-CoA acetyltransferase
MEVASGNADVALAVGVEKLFCGDSAKSAQTMAAGTIYAKFGFMFVALYALQLKKGWRHLAQPSCTLQRWPQK